MHRSSSFGIEVSQKEKRRNKGLFRGWGNSSVINATLVTLILLGEVSLYEAVGYTCAVYGQVFLFMLVLLVRMDKRLEFLSFQLPQTNSHRRYFGCGYPLVKADPSIPTIISNE